MKLFALFSLILCLISCSHTSSTQISKEDIREVVFRYQFKMKVVYCISIEGGQDPSLEFMQRFKNHRPPVKPGSQCTMSYGLGEDPGRMIDRQTKEDAIRYSIHSIDLKMFNRAEVTASWARGGLWGESHRYQLRYRDGRWDVVSDKLLAIS